MSKNDDDDDINRSIANMIDNAELIETPKSAKISSLDEERKKRHKSRDWPVIYPSSLQDKPVPVRQWCVPDWIPDKAVTLLTGDGGTGKSLLALQLATCMATGRPFLGMEIARRKALYLSAEDDGDELHRRQDAICARLGLDLADLDDSLAWRVVAGEETLLAAPDARTKVLSSTPLFNNLKQYCVDNGIQLLVIDTAADTFGGLEIDRQQVTRFIRLLESIARETNGAVLLLAHPSKDGRRDGTGVSGSTAWVNAVRSAIYLKHAEDDADGPSDPYQRTLERTKGNFAPTGGMMTLRYDFGHFMVEEGASLGPAVDMGTAEVRVMRAIRDLLSAGTLLSPSSNSSDYAPKILMRVPDLKGMTLKQIDAAINNMVARRELRTAILGALRNRRKALVPADWPPLEDERDPETGEKKQP